MADDIETAFRWGVAFGERRARPGPHLTAFEEELVATLAALRVQLQVVNDSTEDE